MRPMVHIPSKRLVISPFLIKVCGALSMKEASAFPFSFATARQSLDRRPRLNGNPSCVRKEVFVLGRDAVCEVYVVEILKRVSYDITSVGSDVKTGADCNLSRHDVAVAIDTFKSL